MPPVFESDRRGAEEAEEVEVRPRTWISAVGLLWIGNAAFSATEIRSLDGSLVGMVLAVVGALLPMVLARLRGTADGVPKGVWVVSALLWAAGAVEVGRTVRWWFTETPWTLRLVLALDAAVGAIFLACGAYMVSRSLGSRPEERNAFLRGSLVVLALRIGAWVVARFAVTAEAMTLVAVLVFLQGSVVGWVYLRLLSARPHVRRIAGIFE